MDQKEQDHILFQDYEIVVLLSTDPIAEGHLVVKPLSNYKQIDELPIDLLNKLTEATLSCVKVIKEVFDPKGYSMTQNGGEFTNSNSLEFHIFPRHNKEEFAWTYSDEDIPENKNFAKIRVALAEQFNHSFNSIES